MSKIDLPQFVKDQLKKQSISPDVKPRLIHRRFTSSQLESVTPINSNKKQTKKQSSNPVSLYGVHGLQQLLKTSPYSKVMSQKSYSQMIVPQQDSFSQQYLKDANTPLPQTSYQQNFFKSNLKVQQSQNSTMSSSVKPRMRSANKEILQKKSVETTQVLSNREKQTIGALQQIILRTSSILIHYQAEINRHIQEKDELIRYIRQMQQN
ncbi:hypothetical protein pb186bvf_004475 [Paramecium bursaria]